jgi:hypothetical protein
VFQVPWPSNWNETTARAFCENYLLQSDLGQKCMAATGYDFETEVLACIYSIKVFALYQLHIKEKLEFRDYL